MLLDKKTYDEYVRMTFEKNYEELERRMNKLNEDLVVNYVQDYLEGQGEKIKIDLKNSNRFKKILSGTVTDWLSYRVGTFDAVILIFELLISKKNKKQGFIKRIKALSMKKNVNKVLLFLYKNPDAQHKIISEKTDLKVNYLSQIMRELESAGCVERYVVGKRSFYSLSAEAQEFLYEENFRKDKDVLKYRNNGYMKYGMDMDNQICTIYNEKYGKIKYYKNSLY